jgi:hypothetical protein
LKNIYNFMTQACFNLFILNDSRHKRLQEKNVDIWTKNKENDKKFMVKNII